MKFVSTAKVALVFAIDGTTYGVPVGGSCEIPDRIAYVVKSRGLPMVPASEVKPAKLSADEMSEAELEAATAPKPAASRRARPSKGDVAPE